VRDDLDIHVKGLGNHIIQVSSGMYNINKPFPSLLQDLYNKGNPWAREEEELNSIFMLSNYIGIHLLHPKVSEA
jgi:hypothetical protein